jgi:hypothetical protein
MAGDACNDVIGSLGSRVKSVALDLCDSVRPIDPIVLDRQLGAAGVLFHQFFDFIHDAIRIDTLVRILFP